MYDNALFCSKLFSLLCLHLLVIDLSHGSTFAILTNECKCLYEVEQRVKRLCIKRSLRRSKLHGCLQREGRRRSGSVELKRGAQK